MNRLLLLVAALVLWLGPLPVNAAPPPLPGKVHAVLAFDTDSNLGEGLRIDMSNVRGALKEGLPGPRLSLKELTGKQVTARGLLDALRNAPVGPNDTLLLYYGGHGGRTPAGADYMSLESERKKPLMRAEVLAAMQSRKARLVVLLTDCCSNTVKMPKPEVVSDFPPVGVAPKGEPGLAPLHRFLFLEAKGVVDVTAATNAEAFGDDEQGGLFTRSLCRQLDQPDLRKFRPGADGKVAWKGFFDVLKSDTETSFQSWASALRRRGEKVEATKQVPQAFKLPQPPGGPEGPGKPHVVLTLVNKTDKQISYRARWQGEPELVRFTLAAGESKRHWRFLPDEVRPVLEVQAPDGKWDIKLPGEYWAGAGQPDGDGKRYVFLPRKVNPPK